MNTFRTFKYSLAAILTVSALAGCGNQAVTPKEAGPDPKKADINKSPEPVKVTMYNHWNNISDARLQQFLIEPIKSKLPHVTFEVVKHDKGSTIEELVAAGKFTDFFYGSNVGFPTYMGLQLQHDMNELIKKHKFDLSRIDPVYMDAMQMFGEKGEVYGIPFSANVGVMLYNKGIFDKFGVPYPKDGMTWDEAIDLGRRLTRSDGGVNYIGFDPGTAGNMASGLSLPYVENNTAKAIINNESWRKIFDVFKRSYEVPGYINDGKFEYGIDAFFKEKKLAMMPVWALQVLNLRSELSSMDWDMVTLPNFKENVGRGREVDIHLLAVSSGSKSKDAAMEVLKVITSDEVQKLMSENGTPSILKSEEIKKVYGSKVAEYKGKNVQALFKTKPGAPHKITKYDSAVSAEVEAGRTAIVGGIDLNTVIRTVEEKANQKLSQIK